MCHTNFIAELPQLFQRIRALPELLPGFEAYRVDHKVRVGIVRIAVGANQNLMTRPRPRRKFHGEGVSLFRGDRIVGIEGLDVMIIISSVRLSIRPFRHHELRHGVRTVTVHAGDQSALRDGIIGFIFSLAVVDHAAHGTDGLALAFEKSYRRHDASSVILRSCS